MKRYFKVPPQVFRILLLAAGIVSSYGMARYIMTPPSFGEFGFYRGAAIAEATALPVSYAGRETCAECHPEVVKKLADNAHKNLSCEGCHGPAKAHADELAPVVKPDQALCIRCHEAGPARPKAHKQVAIKNHYTGLCTECHVPHTPLEAP